MNTLILHGEHEVDSRAALQEAIDEARGRGATIERIEAQKVSRAELEMTLGTQSMFDTDRVIIVEGLHSISSQKKRNKFVSLLTDMLGKDQTTQLILWEKRKLTKTMQKKFSDAKVREFKISKPIFDWLDSLTGSPSASQQRSMLQMLHRALEKEESGFVFAMLCRQLRMLLQAKEGSKLKGHPYVVKKVQNQSRRFSEAELLSLHKQVVELDFKRKTGQISISFAAELDQLLLRL